jgi:Asp-tRNA(Asn)/Glu-tRNA(Gln) amidotransferase A subunit family amidase
MNEQKLLIALREGDLTLPEYLAQAEALFNDREPSVQAFLPEEGRFERLLKEAEALILKYPDMVARPHLYGMLAGVKDIFHVEGFKTQAGSRLPEEKLQGSEARSVTRLKNAGALILGKTVTTEFAYFRPGPTRNPHHKEHTPGGSSSGSAAAVGADLCPIALGTQTIGSIIRPAAFCGVVGFKPTYERVSREGVIPLSPSLDHIGSFTQDVYTAKQVASVLVEDWKLLAIEEAGIKQRKPALGIPEGPYLSSASDSALARFSATCDSLARAGYVLRRIPVMNDFQEVRARHDRIMSAEAARGHAAWFEEHADLYSPKFNELIQRGQAVTDSPLKEALAARETFRAQLRQAMIDNNIELWIAPSAPGAAPKGLESTGDPVMNLPWTQAGLPAISLPAGKNEEGLPLGLQLIANWYKDESLLAWVEDIEKVMSTS